jgi:hypothetical protein
MRQRNARDVEVVADRLHGAADGLWVTRRVGHSLENEKLEDLADLLDVIADAIGNGVDYKKSPTTKMQLNRTISELIKQLKVVTNKVDPES